MPGADPHLTFIGPQSDVLTCSNDLHRYLCHQQAKLDAPLLETIAALAGLISRPDHPGNRPA